MLLKRGLLKVSWWDDNDPSAQSSDPWSGAASQSLHDAVAQLYQTALGRAASEAEIQGWISGTQGNLAAIQQGIYGSPEAAAHSQVQTNTPTPASTTTPPAASSGGRSTDPATIAAQVSQWATMPGADPSLANDPNYWVQKIIQNGGLGSDNQQYWQNASVGPNAFFNNPNRESGSTQPAPTAIPNAPTPTSYTPPDAPQYTPYNPGPAPTPTPFTAPTLTDARNSPGFQSAIETADQGINRSAVAKAGISGGLLKDIGTYNIGLADQNYQNVFGNALTANEANNGQALNAYTAGANANIGAGNLNLAGTNSQFTNTYQPSYQSYLSNVAQQQFGANYGLSANQQGFGQNLATNQFNLGAQGQYFNQGLLSNENAYNQYNTSQNSAFDQWYKTAQLGNPGNPYT